MPQREPTSPYTRVSGQSLWQALGFANERAFQRARLAKTISLSLYPMPGQARGVYARSDELAAHLAALEAAAETKESPMKP
ncbi:hypothetical protein PAGU2595_001940 [Lysobacter xanthus]